MGTHLLTPPEQGWADKERTGKDKYGNGDITLNVLTFNDNDQLDTHLLANGYAQTTIDKMTQNDKLYASRQILSPDSVK